VFGQVHRTHATAANLRDNAVVTDALTGGEHVGSRW
jgi:hypothetical protein